VFHKKKCGLFLFHDLLGARRRGLGTGRPRTCAIPARACEDAVAVLRAATGGKCFPGRFAAHTLCRQQRFKEKTPKSHSPGECFFFFTALRSSVALCIAGGRGCCSLAPLALNRRAQFLWLAGQILVKKSTCFFFWEKSWANTCSK
jgi:hypothetical protein